MKSLLILFLAGLSIVTIAQRPVPDQLITSKGNLTIQPILHGSLVLTWDGMTIYVDPYGGTKAFKDIAPPDLILITDIHGDHLNPATLDSIKTDKAIIVAPQAVVDKLNDNLKMKAIVLNNGATTEQRGVSINAIPMYNLPEAADSRHTKGRGNGYVLNLGGKIIYLSGDTSDIPEMRALKNIDVAFLCMNLPYTMDINQASSAVLEFKPAIVYPYHYRGQRGLSDVEGFKKLVEAGNKKIEVRLRNWYPSN